MISKTELCKVIAPSYVEEGDDTFEFYEKKNKQYGLQQVEFQNSGHYVALSSGLLASSKNMYEVNFEEVCFQRDCDKVVLIKKDDKFYMFWIEVKTSLKQISKSAIFQIPGAYYRIKAILDDFVAHEDRGIIECALAVYAPDAPPPPVNHTLAAVEKYTKSKKRMINPPLTPHEQIIRKYAALINAGGKMLLEGTDFGMDKLPILDKYKISTLPCVVWPVTYKNAKVNMEDVIALI